MLLPTEIGNENSQANNQILGDKELSKHHKFLIDLFRDFIAILWHDLLILCCAIFRCTALWEYILELPKAQYTTPMARQILSIVDKICSSAQRNMSHTVTNLVKKFQGSAFFKSVFPDFVNETIEDGR